MEEKAGVIGYWNRLNKRLLAYQLLIFLLTFFSYVSFHSTRKAFTNAKNNLHDSWGLRTSFLGALDTIFLFFYAFGLFISGFLGDRLNPKVFLYIGMSVTSVVFVLFGCARALHYDNEGVLAVLWAINGLAQSIGWPLNVAVMGNWFPVKVRGTVLGIWSANSSVGNIIGSFLVVGCVNTGLDVVWMFVFPSLFVAVVALAILFFLVPDPKDVGLEIEPEETTKSEREESIIESINSSEDGIYFQEKENKIINNDYNTISSDNNPPPYNQLPNAKAKCQRIGWIIASNLLMFLKAWLIPGVAAYAASYACLKLVNYAQFFWLPYYLHNGLDIHLSDSTSDLLSNLYDVGQITGGIVAGFISDRMGRRSPIIVLMLVVSVPLLYFYQLAQTVTYIAVLMTVTGFMLGGPANMISSAIAADLGSHSTLVEDDKMMSTVTGIIDGTGSVGAAIGQYLVAYVSDHYSWKYVFYGLMGMSALSAICLLYKLYLDLRWIYTFKCKKLFSCCCS